MAKLVKSFNCISVNDTLVAFSKKIPQPLVPDVVCPPPSVPLRMSPPVLFEIVPPEAAVPVPVTVKLPLVRERTMPLPEPLPLDDTLVSEMASGVAGLMLLVILTAVAVPVLIVPLVAVMVLVFSVAFNPIWFEVVFVILSAAKVMVLVLLVRLTPLPVELVTLVVPVTAKVPDVLLRLIP